MSVIQECQHQECRSRENSVRRLSLKLFNPAKKIIHFFHRIWRRYALWLKVKEQHRQLMTMNDHMLNDIGLSRADAVRINTGYGFWSHMCGRTEETSEKDK